MHNLNKDPATMASDHVLTGIRILFDNINHKVFVVKDILDNVNFKKIRFMFFFVFCLFRNTVSL